MGSFHNDKPPGSGPSQSGGGMIQEWLRKLKLFLSKGQRRLSKAAKRYLRVFKRYTAAFLQLGSHHHDMFGSGVLLLDFWNALLCRAGRRKQSPKRDGSLGAQLEDENDNSVEGAAELPLPIQRQPESESCLGARSVLRSLPPLSWHAATYIPHISNRNVFKNTTRSSGHAPQDDDEHGTAGHQVSMAYRDGVEDSDFPVGHPPSVHPPLPTPRIGRFKPLEPAHAEDEDFAQFLYTPQPSPGAVYPWPSEDLHLPGLQSVNSPPNSPPNIFLPGSSGSPPSLYATPEMPHANLFPVGELWLAGVAPLDELSLPLVCQQVPPIVFSSEDTPDPATVAAMEAVASDGLIDSLKIDMTGYDENRGEHSTALDKALGLVSRTVGEIELTTPWAVQTGDSVLDNEFIRLLRVLGVNEDLSRLSYTQLRGGNIGASTCWELEPVRLLAFDDHSAFSLGFSPLALSPIYHDRYNLNTLYLDCEMTMEFCRMVLEVCGEGLRELCLAGISQSSLTGGSNGWAPLEMANLKRLTLGFSVDVKPLLGPLEFPKLTHLELKVLDAQAQLLDNIHEQRLNWNGLSTFSCPTCSPVVIEGVLQQARNLQDVCLADMPNGAEGLITNCKNLEIIRPMDIERLVEILTQCSSLETASVGLINVKNIASTLPTEDMGNLARNLRRITLNAPGLHHDWVQKLFPSIQVCVSST